MCIRYNKENIKEIMYNGGFGLERESLRIDSHGYMSKTKHPFPDDPYIQKDFCENQVELVTKVCKSSHEVCDELLKLHRKVSDKLLTLDSGKEYLWPFSNPPYVKDDSDIFIAKYEGELKSKEVYREYLSKKYGKKKMLFSGIHFNFSFEEKMLINEYNNYKVDICYKDFKDSIYLDLAKKVTKYSWLLVYLMSASSVIDESFVKLEPIVDFDTKYASYRCGKYGYWNNFVPVLNYDSVKSYTESIEEYIDDGQLKGTSELYYPVRLKPLGENTLENLKDNGVNHIELRMLDLNPFSESGVIEDDIEFIHLFILYLSSLEAEDFTPLEQVIAIKNEKKSAEFEPDDIMIEKSWETPKNIEQAGINFLDDMEQFYCNLENNKALDLITKQKEKLYNKEVRYAQKVESLYEDNYIEKGIKLAKSYGRDTLCAKYLDLVQTKKY